MSYSRISRGMGEDYEGSSKWSRNMDAYSQGAMQQESIAEKKTEDMALESATRSAQIAKGAPQQEQPTRPAAQPKQDQPKVDPQMVQSIASMFGKKKKK